MIAPHTVDAMLAVIARYDSQLRARMDASPVHVVTSRRAWVATQARRVEWVGTVPPGARRFMAGLAWDDDLGMTDNCSSPGVIGLNIPAIKITAEIRGIPARVVGAYILAHEFRHTQQGCTGSSPASERPAFAAGNVFARRLPDRYRAPLLALSRDAAQEET